MTHLMADKVRVCGRPDGHAGKHYDRATVQREAERMRARRENPGPCTMKGCTYDRVRHMSGTYDVRCCFHAFTHDFDKRMRRREKEWARAGGQPWDWDGLDTALRQANEAYARLFTVKRSTPVP